MRVQFNKPDSHQVREVKVGFSWTLFLFSGFLGVPLFMRRLDILGGVFLALFMTRFLFLIPGSGGQATVLMIIGILLPVVWFCLALWIGAKGNELTAKNYLKRGWVFANPESDMVRTAKVEWGIPT